MKLGNLLKGYDCGKFADTEISGISHNASEVKKGDLFFCLRGSAFDGHDYAEVAAQNGAAAIACERSVNLECPCVTVPSARRALSEACAAFFGNPDREMKTFGITGTNGKTTTSYVLAEILREAGESVGLIGTNCIRYCGVSKPAKLTTPDPYELYSVMRKMKDAGVTAVVMEVSAHALELDKTRATLFDVAGFTNLSRDHLDYFGDMQSYGKAKAKLFDRRGSVCAAVNADDEFGRELLRSANIPVLAYGVKNPADVFGIELKMSAEGLEYVINIEDDIGEVKFALPGRFNMYNTLCAAAMAHLAGVSTEHILRGIRSLKRVDGRFNVINAARFSVIIDFAHTDDGLGNIITSVREFARKRIITVFGCGGNRDKTKRPVMGLLAASMSDLVVITSDNPRDEEPEDIISDVYAGVPENKRKSVYREPDRREAIKLAFKLAEEGDIVIVAGKGAEKYQEIKGVKYDYNDEDYIMRLLQSGEIQ